MQLDLEVLASCAIKRKKPWPKITWVGELTESLYILDTNRASILYVPSGKTKKKIPKLTTCIQEAVSLCVSRNGALLSGLLKSGDVFVWHKDKSLLKIIPGLQDLIRREERTGSPKPFICISNDGGKVLVVIGLSRCFVWEVDHLADLADLKKRDLPGTWCSVKTADDVKVPSTDCKETCIAGIFYENRILGQCAQVSFVFNIHGKVCISTLLLRWFETGQVWSKSCPLFSAEWTSIEQPIKSLCSGGKLIRSRGAFVASYSHDGQVLAVAVNQKRSHDTKMMFASPLTNTVVVSDLHGCGTRSTREGRCYWVAGLEWTFDDLFVVCITKQGSLCILSRLGEPLVLQTHGCSVEMGPALYLPLHPVITVRSQQENIQPGDTSQASVLSEQDSMRQRFSISVHPRLPIILCSDGYLVTVLHLPENLAFPQLVRKFLHEASHQLKQVKEQLKMQMTLMGPGTLKKEMGTLKALKKVKRHGLPSKLDSTGKNTAAKKKFRFEEPRDTMDSTLDSELSFTGTGKQIVFGSSMAADSGKIVFGEQDVLNATADSSILTLDQTALLQQAIDCTQNALLSAWNLTVSYSGVWTMETEKTSVNVAHYIVKMMSVILNSNHEISLSAKFKHRKLKSATDSRLIRVLEVFKKVLMTSSFDTLHQNLLPTLLQFILKTVDAIVPKNECQYSSKLYCVYNLLKYSQVIIDSVYTHIPSFTVQDNEFSSLSEVYSSDIVQPPLLSRRRLKIIVKGGKNDEDSENGNGQIHGSGENHERTETTLTVASNTPSRRLSPVWVALHRKVVTCLKILRKQKTRTDAIFSTLSLLCAIQKQLGHCAKHIPWSKKLEIDKAEKLSIVGGHDSAIILWQERLQSTDDTSPHRLRLLLSILCTYVIEGNLKEALGLVESLIGQTADNGEGGSDVTPHQDSQVPVITGLPNQVVVQTLARLMAAYFSNTVLFIYPPHSPQPLPCLHINVPCSSRVFPLGHQAMSDSIRHNHLDHVWTTDQTMEYLLLSGLLPEATWFARKVGDWKTAFVLAVAQKQHQKMAPEIYSNKLMNLFLPDDLHPTAIMKEMFRKMLRSLQPKDGEEDGETLTATLHIDDDTNIDQLTKTMTDLLMAGAMANVDIVPWLLHGLVKLLKMTIAQFETLVPQGVYLPAPPLYCPQPSATSQEDWSPDVAKEQRIRHDTSTLIQMINIVLKASHLSLPAASWYIQELVKVQDKHVKGEPRNLLQTVPDTLSAYESLNTGLDDHMTHSAVRECLSSMRDFCGLVWLLHARDKLSRALRKDYEVLNSVDHFKTGNSMDETDWSNQCSVTLQWVLAMLPFCKLLNNEADIHNIALSVLSELPQDKRVVQIMAEHFRHEDELDPDVQERLQRILKDWQRVFLDKNQETLKTTPKTPGRQTPKGETLSSYFQKMCGHMDKVFKKRKEVLGDYEEFVFASERKSEKIMKKLTVGSRPYEREESFFDFLDTFYAVSFARLLGSSQSHQKPLLSPFSRHLCHQELGSLAHKAVLSLQLKQQFDSPSQRVEVTTPTLPKDDAFISSQTGTGSSNETPKARIRGLFRSKSFSDLASAGKSGRYYTQSPITKKFSVSQGDLDAVETAEKKKRVSFSNIAMVTGAVMKTKKAAKKKEGKNTSVNSDSKTAELLQIPQDDTQEKPATPTTMNIEMGGTSPRLRWILSSKLNFGKKFGRLSRLLEWLTRWAGKHHSLVIPVGDKTGNEGTAMRLKVHPHMILHTLWLLENKYHPNKGNKVTANMENEVKADKRVTSADNKESRSRSKKGEIKTTKLPSEQKPFHDNSLDKSEISKQKSLPKEMQLKQIKIEKAMFEDKIGQEKDKKTVGSITQAWGKESPEKRKLSEMKTFPESPIMTKFPMSMPSETTVTSFKLSDSATFDGVAPKQLLTLDSDFTEVTKSNTAQEKEQFSDAGSSSLDVSSFEDDEDGVDAEPVTGGSSAKLGGSSSLHLEDLNSLPKVQKPAVQHKMQPLTISIPPPPTSGVQTTQSESLLAVSLPKPRTEQTTLAPEQTTLTQGQTAFPQQQTSLHHNGSAGDIAQQLQDIVRGEIRKIMEIQHSSIIAMMGAMDTVGRSAVTQTAEPVPPSQITHAPPEPSSSQMREISTSNTQHPSIESEQVDSGQEKSMKTTTATQTQTPELRNRSQDQRGGNGTAEEREDTRRTKSTKDQGVATSESETNSNFDLKSKSEDGQQFDKDPYRRFPRLSSTPKRPSQGLSNALRELQNLQQAVTPERVSMFDFVHHPRLLRLPPEKDTSALPILSQKPQLPVPQSQSNQNKMPPIPLLRLENSYVASQMMGHHHKPSGAPYPPKQPPMFDRSVYPERDNKTYQMPTERLQNHFNKENESTYPKPQFASMPMMPSELDKTNLGPNKKPDLKFGLPVQQAPIRQFEGQSQYVQIPLLSLKSHDHGGHGNKTGKPMWVPPDKVIEYEQKLHQEKILKHQRLREHQAKLIAEDVERQRREFGENLLKVDFKKVTEEEKKLDKKEEEDKETKDDKKDKEKKEKKLEKRKRVKKKQESISSSSTSSSQDESKDSEKESPPKKKEPKTKRLKSALKKPVTMTSEVQTTSVATQGVQTENVESDVEQEIVLKIDSGYTGPIEPSEPSVPYLARPTLPEDEDVADQTSKKVTFAAGTKETGMMTEEEEEERPSRVQGSDPVSAAIDEYVSARAGPGAILAPDIFLGLKFGSTGDKDTSEGGQKENSAGRAFISVVDIEGSVDIPEHEIEAKSERKPLPRPRMSPRQEEKAQRVAEPFHRDVSQGPDATTLGVEAEDSEMNPPVLGEFPNTRHKSKQAIAKTLMEMNEQLQAINQMSVHMEEDYKNTRLLVKTIDNIREAMEAGLYPPAKVAQRQTPGMERETPGRPARPAVSPRRRRPSEEHKGKDDLPEVVEEEEQTPEELVIDDLGSPKEEPPAPSGGKPADLDLTGLSGVSDIVGEMLAEGDIKPEDVGLSQREADKLKKKVSYKPEERPIPTELSTDQLKEIFTSRKVESRRSIEDKKRIHEWMARKRKERTAEYHTHLSQLREQELHPYHPTEDSVKMSTSTLKEIKARERERDEDRHQRQHEFLEKRKELAHNLMADMVSDQLELPEEPPLRVKEQKIPAKVPKKSAQRKTDTSREQSSRLSMENLKRMRMEKREQKKYHQEMQQFFPDEYNMGRTHVVQPYDTLTDIDEYEGDLEQQRAKTVPAQEQTRSTKTYKPKPYTALVKLQDPQKLKHSPARDPSTRKTTDYVDRLGTTTTIRPSSRSVKAQQRLYGTKRIPGSSKKPDTKTPRVVKTYIERLQEMKSKQPPTTPLRTRQYTQERSFERPPSLPQPVTRRGLPAERGPRRNTLTYTQQLKQYSNRGAYTGAGASEGVVSPTPRPAIKSHKPAHKPKTYTQQLQELQATAPKTQHRGAYTPRHKKVYTSPQLHSLVRPYYDPYSQVGDDDSVVSPWSVNEDVQRLIYGDEESYMRAGAVPSDTSDDLDYLLGEDYTAAVDIHEISDAAALAELASVSSGSILSVIDWDAVDNLIADVK